MTTFDVVLMHLCFIIWPGLTFAFLTNISIINGRRDGILFSIGDCVASLLLALLGLAGIGALLNTHMFLYNSLRIMGVIYLLYIVYKMFFSSEDLINNGEIKKNENFLKFGFIFTLSYIPSILVFTTILSSMKSDVTILHKILLIIWMTFFNLLYNITIVYTVTYESVSRVFKKHIRKVRIISSIFVAYFVLKILLTIISDVFILNWKFLEWFY